MMLQVVGISPPPEMMPVTCEGDLYQGIQAVTTITASTDPAQCLDGTAVATFVTQKRLFVP